MNFAVMTFFTVAEMCQELNVRHPEEMSLLKSPDDKEGFAKLTGWSKRKGSKVCVDGCGCLRVGGRGCGWMCGRVCVCV